jgi:enoyl-CoA hydratase/carnithine racemase
VEGGVRELLLNRPEKHNALDAEMVGQLQHAFATSPNPSERLAVIRAARPAFCFGIDLHEQARGPEGALSIERMLASIENFPLPVVFVQGDAIADGNELALHCDSWWQA